MEKRHPYSLIGIDGNAFSVIGYVINAMKQCGYSRDAINMYKTDALSDDYNNLLSLSINVEVPLLEMFSFNHSNSFMAMS